MPDKSEVGVDVDELYRANRDSIRRFATRSGAGVDADDVTQDTFERAVVHAGRLDGPAGARRWLYTVAGNTMRDRSRRARRARSGNARLAADARTTLAPPAEEIAMILLEEGLVRAALAGLEAEARQVLVMRIVERKRSGEVAELLGRTPEAVRQIQHRALAALRTELVARGWERSASPALGRATTGGGGR